ncbi:MAG TPA: DNA polymerase IV [Microlunatus sp.]
MRSQPSILHLDLDAFFAAVEQRDKPSLRGKPVVVGGVGQRGVVATASYEARVYGVRSAMPAHEARRRCPHAAFLAGRFGAYREASQQVMAILRDISPLVEPLSLDEAFVDLAAARRPVPLTVAGLGSFVAGLKSDVAAATGGLRASVGVGSSKFIAKVATELAKPDGLHVVEPGREVALLAPMPVTTIPGVGPVTAEKLHRIGVRTISDLHRVERHELVQSIGRTHADALVELAHARDDRPVEPEREAKSISVEDTFEVDVVDQTALRKIIERDARQVSSRLGAARLFARTITLKIRLHDFSTHTRSRTIAAPTDRPELINDLACSLLHTVDTTGGVRLLGVGVAGLTDVLQDRLFDTDLSPDPSPDSSDDAGADTDSEPSEVPAGRSDRRWLPGADVVHSEYGAGWVWGSGLGRVTVRFETRDTPPGPVRTFAESDPALRPL